MPGMLKVGDRFSSFADAKKALDKCAENTHTTFWKRDARTIASSHIVRPIESSLIYYQLFYACRHGGKKFKSYGKNIRKSSTIKEDCPVHVRLKASSDGKALEVTSVQTKHNHTCNHMTSKTSRRKVKVETQDSFEDDLGNDESGPSSNASEDAIERPGASEEASTNQEVFRTAESKEFVSPNPKRYAKKQKITKDPPYVGDAYEDGCLAYAQHIAFKLRNYDQRTRAIVQHNINDVIFQADMGMYQNLDINNALESTRICPDYIYIDNYTTPSTSTSFHPTRTRSPGSSPTGGQLNSEIVE